MRELRRERQKIDRAKKGVVESTVRQFACFTCDSFWWRRVPRRKIVSPVPFRSGMKDIHSSVEYVKTRSEVVWKVLKLVLLLVLSVMRRCCHSVCVCVCRPVCV